MGEPEFDAADLERELDALPPEHRTAFAAACAERLLPNYGAFSEADGWGDPVRLAHGLDSVWRYLEGGPLPAERLVALLRDEDRLAPDTEDFASLGSLALSAAVAALNTFECCLYGDAERAADTAVMCVDTVNLYVTMAVWLQEPTQGEGLRHPLMQGELREQRRALALLRGHPRLEPGLVRGLRAAAERSESRELARRLRTTTPVDPADGA